MVEQVEVRCFEIRVRLGLGDLDGLGRGSSLPCWGRGLGQPAPRQDIPHELITQS